MGRSIPKKVTRLLEDLDEAAESVKEELSVKATPHSSITVTTDNGSFELDKDACEKIFQSIGTVTQFFEALGCPDYATIDLYDIQLDTEVQDELERLFSNVSDG
jgi:hypothetical protein